MSFSCKVLYYIDG